MFKNVASQKVTVYAVDASTGLPKTGDAANITVYVSIDDGTVTVLTDTTGTEADATNAKGDYIFDLSQAETNGNKLRFTGKSSTSNVVIIPQTIYTVPPNFTLTSVDSNGRLDVIKIAGTTQTARDLGTSVLLSSGTGTGQISLSSGQVTISTNNDKTGYSLSQAFPSNFSSLAINGSGHVVLQDASLVTAKLGTFALAKTTNITGFNDIAATAIVSGGAITTSGGEVSTVTTVTNLTNAASAGDFTATMKTSIGTAVAASAVASVTGNVGGNVGGNVTGSVGSVSSGGITRASFAADTGLQTVRSNTAQAGASTTITLDSSASATNDFYNNCRVFLTGGTGAGQSRRILDYVGSTKVATVRAWATNPDNTTTFAVIPEESVFDDITADHLTSGSTGASLNAAGSAGDPWTTSLPGAYTSGQAGFIIGTYIDAAITSRMATYTQPTGFLAATFPGTVASTTNITAGTITTVTNLTNAPTSGDFTATMKTSIGTAVAASAVASVTGNVLGSVASIASGGITSTSFAANSITASAMAADCIGASELAADAVAEIQNGLSTLTSANVSDAVWNAATASYGTSGSYGLLIETFLDAAISSRMATYAQPTGFLAATFPGTVASTTNITAGTITTVTNLTNAPTAGDFTATMKTSIGTAVAASAVASVTGNVGGNVAGSVGSIAGITFPTNFSSIAITAAGKLTVGTNDDKAGYALLSTGLNLVLIDGKTLPVALQYIGASAAGLVSGAGTGTEVFKGLDGSTTRLTVTVDTDGNRSAITYG